MQRGIDSRIQAKVRILLARRWVDLRSVTVGTTNGVVYIGGQLRATGGPELEGTSPHPLGRKAWCERLRKEIHAIPEVQDVVFRVQGCESTGDA